MSLTLYLAPGRASSQGDCERGCTAAIMSPDCPSHGFAVTRVRARFVGCTTYATGEVSLLAGLRFMRFLRTSPDAPMSVESIELVDVSTGRVVPELA